MSKKSRESSHIELDNVFAALSDPTRRAMLKRLLQGDATVNDLAAPFKMSLPAISKHIKVLEKAGLLTKTIQKQQRPCKLNGAKLKQALDWIDQYKQLWDEQIKRLEEVAATVQTTETAIGKDAAADDAVSNDAINSIAPQAIITPTTAQNAQIIPKADQAMQTKAKAPKKTKRKDDDQQQVQPQIGFDF